MATAFSLPTIGFRNKYRLLPLLRHVLFQIMKHPAHSLLCIRHRKHWSDGCRPVQHRHFDLLYIPPQESGRWWPRIQNQSKVVAITKLGVKPNATLYISFYIIALYKSYTLHYLGESLKLIHALPISHAIARQSIYIKLVLQTLSDNLFRSTANISFL